MMLISCKNSEFLYDCNFQDLRDPRKFGFNYVGGVGST